MLFEKEKGGELFESTILNNKVLFFFFFGNEWTGLQCETRLHMYFCLI